MVKLNLKEVNGETIFLCCIAEDDEDIEAALDNFSNSIKIVVPEGKVVGVNPDNMQTVTWQYKVV